MDYRWFSKMIMSMILGLLIAVSPYVNSVDDYEVLCRIVEAEATDGTFEQKVNVAYCIMARIDSKDFPNTVKDVVFDKGQFTPVIDKRYYSVRITEETKSAVEYALWNASGCHDCTYFCTDCQSYRTGFHSKLKEVFFDGVHHYFVE